ncbi:histone acetyltransferase 1 [Recurvomyces mirabilis]|uniref:Histone acetyltransferase type B catalytic subunit n=1 Tax=Recurvomyces mirabilis TaxID=574656 RepID=A0AAE0WHT3_9PEZI|nr:histone acetyltransferase 1 [Recurvomyces mirabilis]KAK5150670.1 histone acetyltransferase 1 [Recurvomyces mirabilis]
MEVGDELTAEITAQVEEWSTNSTACTTIHLYNPTTNTTTAFFQPEFTYPIFGEEEAIFGYRDLSIDITFAAHNLRPHVKISHGKKFQAHGEVRPTDVKAALADFLPESAFGGGGKKDVLRDDAANEFVPPGRRIAEYSRDGINHEIWCASLADSAARELLENMQILIPLFIEGGSMLQLEHDWSTKRWKLFLLYRLDHRPMPKASPYSLVGYGTSYRVSTLPSRADPLKEDEDAYTEKSLDKLVSSADSTSSPLDLPSRERLSQFLILPPYQGAGHGQQLYNTMYSHLTIAANVHEFTVEDPNEAFDDLRDICDLQHLRAKVPEFAALRLNTELKATDLPATSDIPLDLILSLIPETRTQLQRKTKLTDRQLNRLIEMHTLSFIPASNRSRSRITRKLKASNEFDRAFYLWRLMAKQRLYLHNRDLLAQVERVERVEKLEGVLEGVVEGYVALLERVEKMGGRSEDADGEREVKGGAVANSIPKGRKRRVVDEDDDEEDERDESEMLVDQVPTMNGKKRVRMS